MLGRWEGTQGGLSIKNHLEICMGDKDAKPHIAYQFGKGCLRVLTDGSTSESVPKSLLWAYK